MALPNSGPLSMNAINVELGRSGTTPNTLLAGGSTPTAGSLFGLANSTINKVAPHSISEFYGYSNTPLLLDTYPLVGAAYSIRKLRSAYAGFCLRVKRSNDNATLDVGFTNANIVDTSAITTFVGANTGTVVIWYDQSGNGYNATEWTGFVSPPIIVNAGTLQTLNTKVAISFSSRGLLGNSGAAMPNMITTAGLFSAFGVGSANDTSTRLMMQIGGGANHAQAIRRNGSVLESIAFNTGGSAFTDAGNINVGNTQFIACAERRSTSIEIFTNAASNGATATSGTARYTNPVMLLGLYTNSTSFAWNGLIQELITFAINPAVETTYRSGVTTNLNTFYGTY